MQHSKDKWVEEVDCINQPWPDDVKNPPFVKIPKNLKCDDAVEFVDDEEAAAAEVLAEEGLLPTAQRRGRRRDADVRDFFSMEAAEDGRGESEDDEEEDSPHNCSDVMDGGEPGPARAWVESEGETEPSALTKFIDAYINERFYGYTFVAHASAGFDSLLLIRALLMRRMRIEPIYEGGRILLLRVPHLRLSFIDSYRC